MRAVRRSMAGTGFAGAAPAETAARVARDAARPSRRAASSVFMGSPSGASASPQGDGETHLAELEHVAVVEGLRALDLAAVDARAVGGPEVLRHERAVVGERHRGMPARDRRMVDAEVDGRGPAHLVAPR